MEVLPQHVGDDLLRRPVLRLVVAAVLFGFGLIPFHDIVPQTRCFDHFIQIFLLVERIDALVSLEGLTLSLQEVLAIRLHVVVVVPIAETLARTDRHSALRHTLCVLHPVTAIIIFSPFSKRRDMVEGAKGQMNGCDEDRESLGLFGAFLGEVNFIYEVKHRLELAERFVLLVVVEPDVLLRGNDAIQLPYHIRSEAQISHKIYN
jgi:hypothetical protein